jgi:hypothetical protein
MNQEEYHDRWLELSRERERLTDQRATIETELSEINTQIDHLEEVLSHLAPLAGISSGRDLSGLGITVAIRTILKGSGERLSAQDVRRLLDERGFDLSRYSSPMASIYKILARLAEDHEEITREKEDFKVFYHWVTPEISDDDIPF